MTLEKSHILICRTDNIGDVILTLPLAGYLKSLYPDAQIGLLCRAYAAPAIRQCKALDYVVEIEQVKDAVKEFKNSDIDTIIFAKPDKRLAAAAKKAGIKYRVGTSHRWFHWLYCNRRSHFSRVKSALHEAQLNFELLKPLGINHIPTLEDIPALYRLEALPYQGQPNLTPGRFNIVLHPKSNGNGREWPIAHYTELARLLQPYENVQLWVTGSEREGKWIEENAPDLLAMANVGNVCGKFALDELAAFIKAADGLIASGTGPLHLSAALGQRTLGLFPPIRPIDPARWGALGVKAQVLCKPSGCGKCKDAARCTCMESIAPSEVADVVLQWRDEMFETKSAPLASEKVEGRESSVVIPSNSHKSFQ